MPTYAITEAWDHVGRLVISELLARGVPAREIVALVRLRDRGPDLADRGVEVRKAACARPLGAALAGVDRLLLVSSGDLGQPVGHDTDVIRAASAAGVSRLVYMSVLKVDRTANPLAVEPRDGERAVRAAGVPFTVLRTSRCIEDFTDYLDQYLAATEILGATGHGRISAASRRDYAAAAAAAILRDEEGSRTYELGGPAFDLSQLARTINEVTGAQLTYRDLPVAEYATVLRQAGLDRGAAQSVAALDTCVACGDFETSSQDLVRLLGRPVMSLAEVISAACENLPAARRDIRRHATGAYSTVVSPA